MQTQIKSRASLFSAKGIAQIGILSAISTVLMLIEIPLWFTPGFYKIDLSDVPVLIGSFAMGPMAGVVIELIKNLLHIVLKGTMTGGVGELANFLIGCSMVVPSAILYQRRKSKKSALIGMAVGTVSMGIVGCLLNYYLLLPVYAAVFHMQLQALVQMGAAVNSSINSLETFVILAVAPFNLLKGVLVSIITFLLYKHVSPILHR
ncbi:MAG: ECF transporter S component [Clostridiales bacterium]|nr:ECF transporter S component [Clostridiales bacterium]